MNVSKAVRYSLGNGSDLFCSCTDIYVVSDQVMKSPFLSMGTTSEGNLMDQPTSLFQASLVNGLIADEYLKDAKTPEEIRDAFTEIIGDLLMTLPVVKVAGYHSG